MRLDRGIVGNFEINRIFLEIKDEREKTSSFNDMQSLESAVLNYAFK